MPNWWARLWANTQNSSVQSSLDDDYSHSAIVHQWPSRQILDWTPDRIRQAIYAADGGNLIEIADLYTAIRRDARVSGVMATRTLGQISLPLVFEGESVRPRKYVECHWWDAVPESELGLLLEWGLGLGVGLGQLRWDDQNVPHLCVWDPRWLRLDMSDPTRDPVWKLQTAEGLIDVTPGDGQWILYTPYGEWLPWRRGLWNALAIPWLLKTFSLFDRANHSQVAGSPAWIGKTKGLSEAQRRRFLSDLSAMGRNARIVLPQDCDVSLLEATGRTWDIYTTSIDWADKEITIAIAGQVVTTEGSLGFAEGDIHERVLHSYIKAAGETLSTCLHRQLLTPWIEREFGPGVDVPWPRWRTEPPEDLQRKAASLQSLGQALMALDAALAPSALRIDVHALVEQYQIPVRRLAPESVEPEKTVDTQGAAAPMANTRLIANSKKHTETRKRSSRATWSTLDGEPALPNRFRLFAYGRNDSDKGFAVVTPESAKRMVEARKGRDVMIDLEHGSLDGSDKDARGWGQLSVESDGVWLVNVKWTNDGAERLLSRKQRYFSPAFFVDENDTVTELINVALTALPATHFAPALIAASIKEQMDPKQMLEMLGLPPETTLDELAAKLSEMLSGVSALLESGGASSAADAVDEASSSLAEAAELSAEEAPNMGVARAGSDGSEPAPESAPAPDAAAPAAEPVANAEAAPADAPADDSEEDPKKKAMAKPVAYSVSEVALRKQNAELQRENMLLKEGDCLSPELRAWALTQSPAVVRSLINSQKPRPNTARQPIAGATKNSIATPELLAVAKACGMSVDKILKGTK